LTFKSSPSGSSHINANPGSRWQGIFAALKVIEFRKYWFGLMILNLAGQLQAPAQSWLAYQITGSPLKLTLVMGVQSIPMFLLSLYSGVIIDRIHKRDVIVATQVVNAAVACWLGVLLAIHHIQYWHLLLGSFISGINGAFNMTARNAIIAELVPREKIYNAIALNNMASNISAILGPAICGILIGVIGTQGAYFSAVACFVIGIIIVALIPVTSLEKRVQAGSMINNLVAGLRYLRGQRLLVPLLVLELALTLFGVAYSGLMPVFADKWNLQSTGYGFLLSASGIGSMLGSLAVASLGNYKHKGRLLLLSGVIFGITVLLFANTGHLTSLLHINSLIFYFACFLLIAVGFFVTTYATTSNTCIQMNSADEFRGRVNGVYSMVVALYPVANLGVGAMAEAFGATLALTINGSILTVIMIGALIFVRPVRRME
jgi:MFS family permease